MTVEISLLIAIIGCLVGLAGWLSGRDKKISNDAQWRGSVDAKLDSINTAVGGVGTEIKNMRETLDDHGQRISTVEESTQQAHLRLDRLEGAKR